MNIKYVTTEGDYKIVGVTEVEIGPIRDTDMYAHDGNILIMERGRDGRKG